MATKRDFVVKNGLVVTEDIELGHASDTTIARASAGQITVEGTAVVLAGSASHDGFSDFVANEHIDHSGVSITAGNGLTGGGTIASTRTLTVGAGTGVTVNANDVAIGQAVGTSDDVTFATVTLASDLIHSGDTNNKIAFGTDTQSFETGGTARINISDSGLQIGSGARVTTINTSFSDNNTSLMTSAAIDDRIQSFGYTTNTGDITGVDLTGGTGVTIGSETNTGSGAYSSTISIGQAVGTSDDVTFATVTLASDLIHSGDTNNKIAFGTDTQSFQTGGTARFNISDSGLQIGSGARVTTINTSFSDNNTSLMTSAAINDRIESFGYITSQMTFILEDDDGTEVSISNAEEIKFHSGDTSVDINYSDISPGSDADPFDLDFRTIHAPYLKTDDDRDFAPEDLANTIREISGRFSTKTGLEDGSTTSAADYVDVLVLDTFTGHTGGDANLLAFAKNSTKRIYHYRADQDDTNWGTASTVAYTSDIADLTVSDLAAAAVVTESEGIGSNDNDTTLPTSAAVKDYVDSNAGGASALGDLSDAVTTATSNIGIGSTALDSLTASSGNYNVALGVNAGTAITTGDNNIAIGYQAGNTISTQSSNTMVGFEAGKSATSAESTYIGYYAGRNNLSNYNTAVGAEAMITYGDKTAERNVAVGNAALKVIQTGDKNVSVGAYSGLAVTTGSDNTFLGYGAGDVVNSGSNNILLGYEAGDNITSGSNNLVIGDFQVDVATGDDQIIIGSGDGGVTWIKGDSNGIKALKIKVKPVTGNTTLTDAQSGSYVYWTAGTLTLPATAEMGQQYTIINNTGGSATPSLGTSNAIASGWTSHAAMADETARTYVSVATNTWIYIG